jgi:hypothetical protein
MLTDAERYGFDCTGFFRRPGAVDPDLIRRVWDAIVARHGTTLANKFPVMPSLGPVIYELLQHPLIAALSEFCCGEHFRIDHSFGVSGGLPQLHGGPDTSQRSCFWSRAGEHDILASRLSIGVVLLPQSAATGGVCYIPGSHNAFDRRRTGQQILQEVYGGNLAHPDIVCPTLEPGDIVAFSESIVHGDTGWRGSQQQRATIYFAATPGWMAWRDPAQQARARAAAPNDTCRRMLAEPWTSRCDEDDYSRTQALTRRERTLPLT